MAPSLSFRGQPFAEEDTVAAFLRRALADPALTSLAVVAAWARVSGLGRLQPELLAFRRRGGRLRVIAGIDEGGASRPGLKLAMRLADEAYVFHDREARTFHPKLYLAEGDEKALLLVGSSNATAGGLFGNYEASLEAGFELPAEAGANALAGARAYVETLLEDEELCLRLDEALLERLLANPRYGISKTERRTRKAPPASAAEEVFGASRHAKPSLPPLPQGAPEEPMQSGGGEDRGGAALTVTATWSKILPRSDAQRTWRPTGNLRLTKAGQDIPSLSWFRTDLFGSAGWSAGRDGHDNPVEAATVEFAVTVDGEPYGNADLRIVHAPHRESKQRNHEAVLHWGSLLPLLRETDYTKATVTIRRMLDGSFRLDLAR